MLGKSEIWNHIENKQEMDVSHHNPRGCSGFEKVAGICTALYPVRLQVFRTYTCTIRILVWDAFTGLHRVLVLVTCLADTSKASPVG